MKGVYSTTMPKGDNFITRESSFPFVTDKGRENNVVNLYPNITYQAVDGFGGAATEAACYVYSELRGAKREEALNAYFTRQGAGYTWARVPVDSCDFSLGRYCAVSGKDEELSTFSLSRDRQLIIPFLLDAQKAAGTPLKLMLSPWSPPAFMKTNGIRMLGGSLKESCYELYARYLCRYVQGYRELGLAVKLLSIQNEPKARQPWDSCLFTAEQEKRFLQDYLYPRIQLEGLEDLKICIWDHNKERSFDRACEIIDETTEPMVGGVAFHWYSGDHFDALRLIRERFPSQKLVMTESCIEYHSYAIQNDLVNAQRYAHDLIGNLNAGMNLFFDWNLYLNESGGPNYTGNYCDAPILCDLKGNRVLKQLSHTYLCHFSKSILPGAKRIAFTQYTSQLEVTAFRNPDGGLAVVIMNPTALDYPVAFRLNGQMGVVDLPAESLTTVLIPGE